MTAANPSAAIARVAAQFDAGAVRALANLAGLDQLAAEGCLRVPIAPLEIVVGFGGEHRAQVVAACEAVAPAHAARVGRWLDALAGTTDVGFKVSPRPGDLQIYARGTLEPAALAAAFSAADAAYSPRVVKNALALFDQSAAAMAGLELRDDAVGGAVYASLPRSRKTARAIDERFRFLAGAMVPNAPPVWTALGPALLETAGEETAYVSFAPVETAGWVKLDVGRRPLSAARRAVEAAGHAAAWPELAARLERDPPPWWSHIGVRLADSSCAVVLYHPIA